MKKLLLFGAMAILAGCGGSHRFENNGRSPVPLGAPTANGPIKTACLASDRKARSSYLCGCIQAVADQTLSNRDQARAVRFYNDPAEAQEIRQSDRSSDERFWKAYSDYGDRAARICN